MKLHGQALLLLIAFLLACTLPEESNRTNSHENESWGYCPEEWVGGGDTGYLFNKWSIIGICPDCPTCGLCNYGSLIYMKRRPTDSMVVEGYGKCSSYSGVDTCWYRDEALYAKVGNNPYQWRSVGSEFPHSLNITLLTRDSFALEYKYDAPVANTGCLVSLRTNQVFIDANGNPF